VSISRGMQERTRVPKASVLPAICGSTSLSNAMWCRDRRPAWVLSRAGPQQMRSGASFANPARSLEDTTATGKLGSEYLALCLTVKNNHRYIREWVAHHRAVGAGELYTLPLKTLMPADVMHTFSASRS
jgi:phage tail sheath gpL-like